MTSKISSGSESPDPVSLWTSLDRGWKAVVLGLLILGFVLLNNGLL
jgi:hypothetical protein